MYRSQSTISLLGFPPKSRPFPHSLAHWSAWVPTAQTRSTGHPLSHPTFSVWTVTQSDKFKSPCPSESLRADGCCHVSSQVVGRLASEISIILQGKDKPSYNPKKNEGDVVIVVNAAHVHFTHDKWETKLYRHHTGEQRAPGVCLGLTVLTHTKLLALNVCYQEECLCVFCCCRCCELSTQAGRGPAAARDCITSLSIS